MDLTDELQERICTLTEAAAADAADPAGGVTRLLYSREWVKTLETLKRVMEQEGMETRFDEIGNLYGRIQGTKRPEETILTGSHVDSVRNGGKYDGMYGILAGILAIGYLNRTYGPPERSLEVVAFAEEEGSRFPTVFWGSKNFLGIEDRTEAESLKDEEGISFSEAMRAAGFDFKKKPRSSRTDVKAFLEAHIEQGPELERHGKLVGIVDRIVGQRRFSVRVTGTANHAGTTPMGIRRDALLGAARMICRLMDRAKEIGPPLVVTAGHLEVKPNMGNVVPGEVEFSLDVRHTEEDVLETFTQEIRDILKETADEAGLGLSIHLWMKEPSVRMDEGLVGRLEEALAKSKVPGMRMHSGAGHDSQLIARKIPTAMLFVPSKDGISHNPKECTSPGELAAGIRILANTLHGLAYSAEEAEKTAENQGELKSAGAE